MTQDEPLPLAGLVVLDISSFIAAPAAAAALADYGADVIKIEPPGDGDPHRNSFKNASYPPSEHNFPWQLDGLHIDRDQQTARDQPARRRRVGSRIHSQQGIADGADGRTRGEPLHDVPLGRLEPLEHRGDLGGGAQHAGHFLAGPRLDRGWQSERA